MAIKSKKAIKIESPEIGYDSLLTQMSVTESLHNGQVVKSISMRLIPYRVIEGRIEERQDLAETISWSSLTGSKQDKRISKALAAIEKAVQALVDEE